MTGVFDLQTTFISKRIIPVVTDNEMIQNGNIQKDIAILDLLGDLIVGFDGLEVARQMVVTQDKARFKLAKDDLEDLFRINYNPRDSTFGYMDFFTIRFACSVSRTSTP